MDAGFPNSDSTDDAEARAVSQRAEQRDSMLLSASLQRASGGAPIVVKVRNLSSGGLMAEVPTGLLREERVEIDLRGIGMVPGRVAWVAPGRVGIAFDHPIDHKATRKPVSAAPPLQLVRASRNAWRPGLR